MEPEGEKIYTYLSPSGSQKQEIHCFEIIIHKEKK